MRHSERQRERGSVFIVSLMVLVMLTVIGLSLALVTETEMLIGGNEQVINETFYASETAAAVAVSQLLVAHSMESKCMALLARDADDSPRMLGVENLGYSIDYTQLYPVAFDTPPGTQANAGDEELLSLFVRSEARALRGSWLVTEDPALDSDAMTLPREQGEALEDADFTVQAEKNVQLAFFVSPLQGFESGTLVESFDRPEILGCDRSPNTIDIPDPGP